MTAPSRTDRASSSVKAARAFLALDGNCDRYLARHPYRNGECTRCSDKARCGSVRALAWAAQQERDLRRTRASRNRVADRAPAGVA